MTKEQINEYTLRISQANRSQIVVILYDMAIQYIDDAKEAIKNGDHECLKICCGNAGRVVSDLIGALDDSYELAVALRQCYIYIQSQISMAVIKNSQEMLMIAEKMLKKLKESFEKVAQEDNTKPLMSNTESVYAGFTYGKRAVYDSLTTEVSRGYKV